MRDLRPLFDPRSVAVLGASNDPAKWGQWIAAGALRGADRRDVWLVNRNGGEILGHRAYRSLEELPGVPELVVVSLPAAAFEDAVDASLAAGARAIVAITAGLGEVGADGKALERAVVERVRARGSRHARAQLPWRVRRGGRARRRLQPLRAGQPRDHLPERKSRTRAESSRSPVRRRHLALRVSREPGRHRGRRAGGGLCGGRAHPPHRRLLRGFPGRPCVRPRRCRGSGRGQAGAVARGRQQRGGSAGGGLPHGCAGERLGRGRRSLPCRADPAGGDAEGARRQGAGLPGTAPAPGQKGRDRRRRRRHRRRHGRPRHGSRTGAALPLGRPRRAADVDRPQHRHGQPGRPRRSRRAGLLELRARDECHSRVGGGGCRRLHRLLRRLQPDERELQRRRDRGRPCHRPGGDRERPPSADPGDVLGLTARPGAAVGGRAGLPRHRGGRRHARASRRAARDGFPGRTRDGRAGVARRERRLLPRRATCWRRPA